MTITLGDISVRYVNLILDSAHSLGLSVPALQNQFKLTVQQLGEPNARVSIPKYMRLGHEIISQTNRPELGLMAGLNANVSLMGLTGYLAQCAPTLEQSLIDFARFEALSSKNARGSSHVSIEQGLVIAEFYSISPYNEYNLFIVDLALRGQLTLLNRLAGQPIEPVQVQIEFPEPPYFEHYKTRFPCPVKFNQPRNALVFKQSQLRIAPINHNRTSYAECLQICEQQLTEAKHSATFVEQVMNEITPLLSSPDLSIEQVANRLEMPPWTLRRKLQAEQTNFKKMLDTTRHELALIYLRNEQYSLGEVAYLLGFAYPNAFQRAFKRWQGVSPGVYRVNTY